MRNCVAATRLLRVVGSFLYPLFGPLTRSSNGPTFFSARYAGLLAADAALAAFKSA